ncbi:MAG: phage portal protein [Bacillota bacterium]
MGFFDKVKQIFSKLNGKSTSIYNKGNYLESSTSTNVYEASVVRACIHTIAEEASKMVIKSIKIKDGAVVNNNDELNTLFSTRPNELMTMKDMLYWTAYRLEMRSNAYWFPEYVISTFQDGRKEKQIVSLYPINSSDETLVYDETEKCYFLVFNMENGGTYKIKYTDVIHLRKHYGNSYYFGSESRTDLLKKLKIYDQVTELMPKAINASMQLKGLLTGKSLMDLEALQKFKAEFEATAKAGETSIGVVGATGEFHKIDISPQIVDKDVLDHLEKIALINFGVSMKILTGDATENEWQSLYQKNIEPLKIALEQAATSVLFEKRKTQFGNQIKVYDKLVQHLSMKTRLEIIKLMGASNYISRAEQRELIGYEADGGPDRVSLNFVDEGLVNQYQLKNINKQESEKK